MAAVLTKCTVERLASGPSFNVHRAQVVESFSSALTKHDEAMQEALTTITSAEMTVKADESGDICVAEYLKSLGVAKVLAQVWKGETVSLTELAAGGMLKVKKEPTEEVAKGGADAQDEKSKEAAAVEAVGTAPAAANGDVAADAKQPPWVVRMLQAAPAKGSTESPAANAAASSAGAAAEAPEQAAPASDIRSLLNSVKHILCPVQTPAKMKDKSEIQAFIDGTADSTDINEIEKNVATFKDMRSMQQQFQKSLLKAATDATAYLETKQRRAKRDLAAKQKGAEKKEKDQARAAAKAAAKRIKEEVKGGNSIWTIPVEKLTQVPEVNFPHNVDESLESPWVMREPEPVKATSAYHSERSMLWQTTKIVERKFPHRFPESFNKETSSLQSRVLVVHPNR